MSKIDRYFDEILVNAHFWNWAPDWCLFINIYKTFPNSYSILTPFAYSYLEELIRSTTTEYGSDYSKKIQVGNGLLELAIKENQIQNPELVKFLEKIIRPYFARLNILNNSGSNRNNVAHGHTHSRWWDKESFEKLIRDIAKLSKWSGQ